MIENRAAPSTEGMRHLAGSAARFRFKAATAILTIGLLMSACAPNPGPAGSKLRTYAADLAGGAKSCEVPTVKPEAGKTADAAIKVGNDGGWCGLGVQQDGAKPFGAGLLMARPSHGTVMVHAVGDGTRIDYTPDHGFAGSDGFEVKLIPGDATLHVAVTVTAQQADTAASGASRSGTLKPN